MSLRSVIVKTLILISMLFLSFCCKAESFFQIEVGLGAQWSKDMGDGIWIQQGLPSNREKTSGPSYLVGITGTLLEKENWSLAYHLDYVYFGGLSASVDGVPDPNYNPQTHKTVGTLPRLSPFNGQGHTQGIQLLLEPAYNINGYKIGVEAGPWLYWATWHETLFDLANHEENLSHVTHRQFG